MNITKSVLCFGKGEGVVTEPCLLHRQLSSKLKELNTGQSACCTGMKYEFLDAWHPCKMWSTAVYICNHTKLQRLRLETATRREALPAEQRWRHARKAARSYWLEEMPLDQMIPCCDSRMSKKSCVQRPSWQERTPYIETCTHLKIQLNVNLKSPLCWRW